jgi:hypothetical protein
MTMDKMGSFESNEINKWSIKTSFSEGDNILSPLEESHKSMNVEVNRRSSFTFYQTFLSWEGKGRRYRLPEIL